MSKRQNPLVGKTVTAVHLAEDGGAIRFDVNGGEPIVARADGDCCSHTWIENVQAPENIVGSPIVAVEDVGGAQADTGEQGDDCVSFYGCKITSGKGSTLIDYRNESNGYYGGSLEWPVPDGEHDPFYGGVHGQNISKNVWRRLA